jgi:hypothetical protein
VIALTPDGYRYWAMGAGVPVPRPFAYRWLLPALCRQAIHRWVAANVAGLVLLAAGTFALAGGGWLGVVAALIVVTLPMSLFNARHPVLVDSVALGLATSAAAVAQVNVPVAVALALLAGCVKEPAPLFAAAFAWNPWLMLGMVAPLARMALCRPGPDVIEYEGRAESLAHPLRTGWRWNGSRLRSLDPTLVWPWGGALAGLAALDVRLALVLALAYGQLLLATDSVRLYQWAGPAMAVSAASVVPPAWWPVLLAACVFSPFRGDQV